jgi:hypothetical protein
MTKNNATPGGRANDFREEITAGCNQQQRRDSAEGD